jgi:hypothetical protein
MKEEVQYDRRFQSDCPNVGGMAGGSSNIGGNILPNPARIYPSTRLYSASALDILATPAA